MSSYFYPASRLTKLINTDEENLQLDDFFKSLSVNEEKQWEFFNYCKNWRIAPWIYNRINKNSFSNYLSSDVINEFSLIYENIKLQNENRNKEAKSFLKKFNECNIDVTLLKGNLFIHTVYSDTGYKKMNDFDMLIHYSDWEKAKRIFNELSYIPLGFGWTGEKSKASKFSHAGLSYISPNYHCITGTQWGLKSPTSAYNIDMDELWTTTTDLDFYGLKIKQLSTEYNLLHLVLHMGLYKIGIRDCMDIYNLILASPEFNEDTFVEICVKSNARQKAYFTFKLVNECCDIVSSTLLKKINTTKKSFIINRLHSRTKMAKQTGDFQLSYNDYFHDVEMTVFYFNLFHKFHQKAGLYLKLLVQIFLPEKNLAYKFSDLNTGDKWLKKAFSRVKAPFLIIRLIGEEIGTYIVFMLLLKLFVNVFTSIKNYFTSPLSYFEYLRNRQIEPEEIKKVVMGIE